MTPPKRLRIVSALGVIQIFAWGSSYYLMAILAKPIAEETGLSASIISGGVTLGFLVEGLAAIVIGHLIHARGGRTILAAGIALLAAGLALLSVAHGLMSYFLAWIIIGLGMSGALYDAAFSTLGRIFGAEARPAITQLTLWGGFASTVCWPLTAEMTELVGWRGACATYAALHALVFLPLALWAIPREGRSANLERSDIAQDSPSVGITDTRFLCILVAGLVLSALSTIWSIQLVTMLTGFGYSTATAIAIGTLIGPCQVGARFIEMLTRGRYHPVWTMSVATSTVFLGFAGLLAGIPAAVAMIAYGAGNGLWSIARGALPLALFGPRDYPRVMGRLATPVLVTSAAAPTIGAWSTASFGPQATLWGMTIAALLPLGAAIILASLLKTQAEG